MISGSPQGGLPPCTPPGRGWTRAGGPSGSWPPRSHRDHHTRRRTRDPDQRPGRRRLCSDLGWFSCNLNVIFTWFCHHEITETRSPFMLDTPTLSLELAQLCECFRLKESWWPSASLFLVLKLFNSFCHRDSRPAWHQRKIKKGKIENLISISLCFQSNHHRSGICYLVTASIKGEIFLIRFILDQLTVTNIRL